MQDIALITGASTGLGIQIAVQLAAKSQTKVYATMRNLKKRQLLEKTAKEAGVSLEVKQLDVQEPKSIEKCVSEILAEEGKIDILINNAGAGFFRTTEHATEEEVKWALDVNFMGVVRCTKAVLPNMRRLKSGRIINISSVGGLVGQPFNEFYCAAKFAVEGYTESLASYVQPAFNIKFSIIEPGGIRSEFAKSALESYQKSTSNLEGDYHPILKQYMDSASSRTEGVYQDPEEVAEVVIECINQDNPPIRVRTSTWANDFCDLKTKMDPTGKILQEKIISTCLPSAIQ